MLSTGPKAPTPLPGGEAIKHGPARPRKTWGSYEGTAAQYLTTTAEERIEAISDEAKADIAARYGATFRKKETP